MIFPNCSPDRVLQVLLQQVLDPVLGVTGLPAAAVELTDRAAPHVAGGFHGKLDDVEQVHGDLRARQHPLHRGLVDRAHAGGDDLDRVAPVLRGAGQPVRSVIGGAAFGLAEHALGAGQVVEAGVPAVRDQDVLSGPLIAPPPGSAAAVLVNARVSDRFRVRAENRVRFPGERFVRGRPRDAVVPGGFRWGDAPFGEPRPRSAPAAAG